MFEENKHEEGDYVKAGDIQVSILDGKNDANGVGLYESSDENNSSGSGNHSQSQ